MFKVLKWLGLGFLGFTVLIAVLAIAIDQSVSPEDRQAEERRFAEFQDIQRAKRAVKAAMREPESVRFGRVSRLSTGIVCGYASGRNGFGGMTGMRAFIYGPQVGGLMMEEQGRRRFLGVWNVQCADQSTKESGAPRKP